MPEPDADTVAAACLELRDALEAEQRSALCLPFDDQERRTWFYWPAPRKGLALGALDGERRQCVHRLLTALVTPAALAKVTTIMGLEIVLADLEARGVRSRRRMQGLPRDPSAYYTTLFGEPGGGAPWGVRFEGHHVSIHRTVVDGRVAPTPLFLGANPAAVGHGPRTVLRPLGEEEDMGRALLGALPATARRRAVIDDTAPGDIVTTNAPAVDADLTGGVAVTDLRDEAAALATALIELHLDRAVVPGPPPPVGDVHFAWAGDAEPGRPHYYRLSGSRFLAEYDNTQNDADHAHSVWRDPADDFGTDALRAHRAAHEH